MARSRPRVCDGDGGNVYRDVGALGLTFPDGFTHVFTFRLCEACGQINVVKDGDYTCAVCLHALPVQRNL